VDWNDLKYLIAITNQGTLKGAAKQLDVNQTTVWRKVQQLETSLSTQLFNVSRKGYQLTEAGMLIFENAKRMESLADGILLQSEQQHKIIQGLVRLTAPSTLATQVLPAWIGEFRQQHPQVEFEILESGQTLNIQHREADIALRASHTVPDNLIARKIKDVGWSIYASKSFLRDNGIRDAVSLDDLSDLPAIDLVNIESPAVQWYRQLIRHNPKTIICNNIETAKTSVLLHQGIALLPREKKLPLVELYSLASKYNSSMWLLANKDLRNTARIKAFWDFLVTKIDEYQL